MAETLSNHNKDEEKLLDSVKFINTLKQLKGAKSYDGDASCQVIFELKNGEVLRIGTTDEDLVGGPNLWADQFLFERHLKSKEKDVCSCMGNCGACVG